MKFWKFWTSASCGLLLRPCARGALAVSSGRPSGARPLSLSPEPTGGADRAHAAPDVRAARQRGRCAPRRWLGARGRAA
jgi:hypothetical protein